MNEFELIEYLTKDFPKYHDHLIEGIGDDCAVWSDIKGYKLMTTDTMVEGDHFRKDWFTAFQIGKRLLEINVSDIASMGGVPEFLFVSLIIDDNTKPEWLREMYDGIKEVCEKYKITLAGGNITHGATLSLTISLTGNAEKVLYRGQAKEGDLLLTTGMVGAACLARLLLMKNIKIIDKTILNKFLEPIARLEEGLLIAKHANSMIDISDGISSEAIHLAKSSRLGVEINIDALPIPLNINNYESIIGQSIINCALRGGEDFELMFSINENKLKLLQQEWKFDVPISIIGKFIKEPKYEYYDSIGNKQLLPKGFDHFSENINL